MERMNESGELRKLVKELQVLTTLSLAQLPIIFYFRTQLVFRLSVLSVEGMGCIHARPVRGARNLAGEAATTQLSFLGALFVIRGD